MIALQTIFWSTIFLIFHSYVLYPLLLKLRAKNKPVNEERFTREEQLPKVSVLMAVYNEENVISHKLDSLIKANYPEEKLEILIGSDGSTDDTENLIAKYQERHSYVKLFKFGGRNGKPSIINQLKEKAEGEVLIITDANVMFTADTIFDLVKHFKNESIGLVDTNMKNWRMKREGISYQEKSYINREVSIKHDEGKLWGAMMGPFGGCYAIRKKLYQPVPTTYLVDDFYICMNVLKSGAKAINDLDAVVFEDVSNKISEEFRRKVRIATGNFQNLRKFFFLLWPPTSGLGFAFLSHKVLRWLGPILLLTALITNIMLYEVNNVYKLLLWCQLGSYTVPLVDTVLKKIKINNVIFRFITHFYSMNLALLVGMLRFMRGVKSGIWEPTKRMQ